MSSARSRNLQIAGRSIRAGAWTVVLAVLAASGAGLVGQVWHPAGSEARAELTYAGDSALGARLDAATARLTAIAADVDSLADEAKAALEEVASADANRLREALERGDAAAAAIASETAALRASLAGLPGDEPMAVVTYGNDVLVRRSTVLAAVDAAAGLAANWQQVAARATEAANLTSRMSAHDQTVLDATAKGRAAAYGQAISLVGDAILIVADVQELRTRLIAGSGDTVLDEWIRRNSNYDLALRAVYQAFRDAGGKVTVAVQRAIANERRAREQLPPDRRTVIVIISEVARGGLTDAVVAIENARARIDEALAEASPPPSESSPAPAGSAEPSTGPTAGSSPAAGSSVTP